MIKITNIKNYLKKYKNKNPVLSSFGNIKFSSSELSFISSFESCCFAECDASQGKMLVKEAHFRILAQTSNAFGIKGKYTGAM